MHHCRRASFAQTRRQTCLAAPTNAKPSAAQHAPDFVRSGAPAGCTAGNAFCYDLSGDLLNDGFHQYSYDIEGRTTAVDNGGASYTFDATGNRVRKDVAGKPSIEYIYFGGQVIAEHNISSGNWSDYIYANGRRIARHDSSLNQVQTQGTCNNPVQGCRSQFWFRNSGIIGYRIQSGDKLYVTQYVATAGAVAGPGLSYKDANGNLTYGDTITNVFDQDGCPMNQDCSSFTGSAYHFRRIDLTPLAGMTVADDPLVETATANADSTWNAYYMDFVLVGADGTVHPFFTGVPNDSSLSMTTWNQPGASGLSFSTSAGSDCPTRVFGVNYYHTDQLGTSRMLTSGAGWPVWQGTFLPFGEEYNPQTTTNHYKFTGKERDAESNLDFFGARSYSSSMGRFVSADWSAMPVPVPYADPSNPQSLNLYAYVRNNPIARKDLDGHFDDPFGTFSEGPTDFSNMGGGAGLEIMGDNGPVYANAWIPVVRVQDLNATATSTSLVASSSLVESDLGSGRMGAGINMEGYTLALVATTPSPIDRYDGSPQGRCIARLEEHYQWGRDEYRREFVTNSVKELKFKKPGDFARVDKKADNLRDHLADYADELYDLGIMYSQRMNYCQSLPDGLDASDRFMNLMMTIFTPTLH